jgi:hypothetical protein
MVVHHVQVIASSILSYTAGRLVAARPDGAVTAGLIVTTALMIWKGLVLLTGSESPVSLFTLKLLQPSCKGGVHNPACWLCTGCIQDTMRQ